MTQVRRSERYYIQDKEMFLVHVEAYKGRIVDCFLNDLSVSGACIIIDKQVFLQRGKAYPLEILKKQENGEFESIASVKGQIVWYLPKDFQGKEMQYLGIEFQENIALSESISEQVKVTKQWS